MPTQYKFSIHGARYILKIGKGQLLRRNRADKTHVEILLPADKGVVGAPEGEIGKPLDVYKRQASMNALW